MKRLLPFYLLMCVAFNVAGQTIIGRQLVDQYPITSWGTKTYGLTWLPADYNSTNTSYPLIIFLHAGGEVGDGVQGLNNLLNAGIPKEIAEGWDPQAVNPSDGKTYKFIVVSPQAPTNSSWSYTYTHVVNILPDVLSRYRVDPKRIYITGISAGGAGTWSCVTNDSNFTKKIAAIIPVSSVGVNNPGVESPNIKYISGKYNVKVWTVCGTKDGYYNTAVNYVNTINTANPSPAVPAKLTGIAGLDHVPGVWDLAYDASWRNNALNLNFYEWMLQYQRDVASPAPNQPPVANAGADKNIKLPTNSVTLTGSGSDADGTISSYLWTKISGPSQFTIASPASAQTVVNNLAAGVYQFELKVTDNKFTSRTDTVAVTVTSLVNKAPSVNAGNDQTITLPVNSVTLTGSGSDSDGTISSYLWTKVSGPAAFSIATANQPQTLINNLVQGTYQFELKVTDNQGASKADTVAVTVLPPPNQPPVVSAGNDQTIVLPTDFTELTGTATDADGTIANYKWTKIEGPEGSVIVSPSQQQTRVNGLVPGTYQFEFKATDDASASKTDTVMVSVLIPPPNKLPVANAGDDKIIHIPADNVLLTGSGSDTDGIISSYHWKKIDGPGEASITSGNEAQTSVTGLVLGIYQFELTVTDNEEATGKDTVVVTVLPPNQPPVANAGDDQTITLPENSITLSGSAEDTDGAIASYLWSKIDGPEQFSIISPNQKQTVISGFVKGVYQFEFKVTDNEGDETRDTVTVTVLRALNQHPVANAGNDKIIDLPNDNVVLTGSGSDTDGIISSYHWKKIDGPDGFSITSENEAQTTVTGLVLGTYQFELTVTDNEEATGKDTVVVTVLPPNQPPVANAGDDKTITLPENSITLSGSAEDTDGTIASYLWSKIDGPEQFSIISPNQQQTTVSGLAKGVYQFELKATDNKSAETRDTVTVTVLRAPNQHPVANAGNDKIIDLPNDHVVLTGSGSDTGGIISSYHWTKIDGPEEFSITSENEAQTSVTGLVLGVYQFELTVTDDEEATGKDTVVVTVLPANQPPVANAGGDQSITLPENSITLSGSAEDADGTIVSYLWSKINGPGQFSIMSPNQQQTIVSGLVKGTYQFELKVTDNKGAETRDTVTVTVWPVPNKLPVANAGSDQTINLPNSSITLSGSGTDPDGTIISYLWSKVAGPGQFSIANPVNQQTSVSNLTQGVYLFELKVTDDSSAVATDTVKIVVLAAPNQLPVAKAGSDQTLDFPVSSTILSGSGTDADGTISSYVWAKTSGPAQFNISNSSIANPVLSNLVAGTYTFRLTVTDNNNASSTDDINIIVNPILAGYKIIPSVIQAESYSTMSGVKTENTSDAGGGLDVGWIDNGDWMDYKVYVDSTANYTVKFRVATANTGAKFQLRKSDGTVLTTISLPNTGSYQGWITLSAVVPLTSGYQTLRIISTTTLVWNFNWVEFVRGVSTGKPIPAKIEAEAYDTMQGIQMEITGDAGGGLDVGWIDNGDWLDYNVNAASAGLYTVNFRVATPNTGAKLQIRTSGGTVLATVNVPRTGGYQTWGVVSTTISIPAGQQTLRIISTASSIFNFNWVEFVQSSGLTAQNTESMIRNPRTSEVSQRTSSFEIAPNPVSDKFVLQITSKNTGVVKVQILNTQGAVRREFRLIKNTVGSQSFNLSSYGLDRGRHVIRVQVGDWADSQFILKL